jgi:cardiolipin hydrolase
VFLLASAANSPYNRAHPLKLMDAELLFTRSGSVAVAIERLIGASKTSIDAALYRLNNPRLARALQAALQRGVRVRLVVDRNKYEETSATRELLAATAIPFRLRYGRQGAGSKMHHKFAIFDGRSVITGSYNWTFESEEQNYENLLVVREAALVETYQNEFEALWEAGE